MSLIKIAMGALLALGSAEAMDLREAAELALEREPRLAAAAASLGEADAGRDIAASGYRPNLQFTASAGYSDLESSKPFPPSGSRTPTAATIALSQPLYTFGRTRHAVAAADAEVAARAAVLEDVRQDLLLATAASYLAVLRDRAEVELNAVQLERFETATRHTRLRLEVGAVTATDLAQAEARLARGEAELRLAEARAGEAAAGLQRLVGRVPEVLEQRWPVPALPASLAAALGAVDEHPAVIAAGAGEQAARQQLRAQRAERLPWLTLEGLAGREDESRFTFATVDSWSVALALTVPLYQGGQQQARTRRAQYALRRAAAELADRRAAAGETIERAWRVYSAYAPVIASVERQVGAAALALEGVRQETELGARTTLELLDAEQEALAARVAEIRARHDRAVAALRLKRAIGRLSLEDL